MTMGDDDTWDQNRCRLGTSCSKSWALGTLWISTGWQGSYPSLMSGGTLVTGTTHRSKLCKTGSSPAQSSSIPTCPFSGGTSGYLYVTTVATYCNGSSYLNNINNWCQVNSSGGCEKHIPDIGGCGASVVKTWPGNSAGYRVECHGDTIVSPNANWCLLCYVP
jgi:hypothetical protein